MAIKYIPYNPEVLEGQAILDNFQRTYRLLYYKDNDQVYKRIERGMPLYEVELLESVGKNEKQNIVMRGECLSACAYLKENGISVDLVYIDPPFASGADYAKKVYLRRNPKVGKAIAQAEAELDIEELRTFEEKMYGDVWDKERYLNWMYENLMAIKAVMSDTGSIYVHLDWHIGHYVKILMDEIFGEDNFRNEIIWYYPNKMSGSTSSRDFVCEHDSIFFYTKTNVNIYNTIKEERAEAVKQSKRVKIDGKNMRARDEDGNVIYETSTDKKIKDVWTIPYIASTDSQRVDYATQKPEALLTRIIEASSNEGMVVADFFGGSGVTAAVAAKLGRKFVHCDVGINSIQTVRDRLLANRAEFDVLEVKDGVSLYRNPIQTMDKLKSLIPGLRSESTLNPIWAGAIVDTKMGMMPVYLPNLKDHTSRLLDIPMMNSIVCEYIQDFKDDDVKRVIVYYIDMIDRAEMEQFIKEQNNTLIEIELRDLKQVLDQIVVNDEAEYRLTENDNGLFGGWKVEILRFHSDRVCRKIEEVNLKGQQQALHQQSKGKDKKYTHISLSEEQLETIEWLSLDCTSNDMEDKWHSDSEIKIDKQGLVVNNGTKTNDYWDGCITSEQKPLRMKIRNICGDETVYLLS